MWQEGSKGLKGKLQSTWGTSTVWEYLRQTMAMTTTTTTKTSPAVAEPTMRGSCSWRCWAPEPGDRGGAGEWRAGRDRSQQGQARGQCTSFTRGLKLRRAAVLPIASHGAGPDLDHVARVRPQPIQLHRVFLAGHRRGDAFAL